MPLYDYQCVKCEGAIIERYIKLSEIDHYVEKCPKCGKHLTRLVSCSQQPVIWGYFSEAMGCHIGSAREKSRKLRELDLYEKC